MLDRLLVAADHALRTLSGTNRAARPAPSQAFAPELDDLGERDRRHAAGLMRVNHVGEVCAQALYQAQALSTRDPALKQHFEAAARDETDHLAWTEQRLGELGASCEVVRNDALTAEEILARKPERIVLSPGPCTPNEAGVCLSLISRVCGLEGGQPVRVPLLGVCLGHQSIGQAFGARVLRARAP
ncbi:MAG TPA: demethoxyubiquinone hydroxylase family protein, partial [Albitalea sp.]|nr:demethoxyubiquinone hydroxylase family protein [Albitalea sp.]